MKENLKNSFWLLLIVILSILTVVSGYYAFKLKEQYAIMTNNSYNESFNSLVNYMNNIEGYLAKSMISKSPVHGAETLTEVWRDSNLALVYLSRIPLNSEGLSQTAKFLNQVSDYSYTLSRKNINNEELTDEDFENIKTLYGYSNSLKETLNQLSEELYTGQISWGDLKSDNSHKFAQAVDNISIFSNIDSNLSEYEGLIYDGAYSDHVNKVEKKGLTGEDISEEDAKSKVRAFFKDKTVEKIDGNGLLENADIPSYEFVIKFFNEDEKTWISISKKGGHIIQMEKVRDVNEEKKNFEEVNEIGKKYLEDKGFPNMKETYYMKKDNIITINYAYEDGNVLVYPDLIKLKIALDNGEIIGIEATGYLNSHTNRTYPENIISIEEAKEKLNPKLNIESERLSVIPTKWKTEIYAYEFKGKVEEKEFLVYINAETGKEEDILVILDTPDGVLTM